MAFTDRCFVGISRYDFDPFWIPQKKEQWCWSACQEMLFQYNGINETQDSIALKLCGFSISGFAGSRAITPVSVEENIPHYCDIDRSGKFYSVNISVSRGKMDVRALLKELKEGRPVVVHSGKKEFNRALVITGAQVVFEKEKAIIMKLYIRDPDKRYANVKGRRVFLTPAKFLDKVEAHWFVNAGVLDIPSHYNQIVAF